MKLQNKSVKYILFILPLLLLCVSCSDDFLETEPTGSTSEKTVFETTDNAKMAINGIARLMTSQWISTQGFNGEGTIKMYYGNYPGNHFIYASTGWQNTIVGNYHENRTASYDYYPWQYYYTLIGEANKILVNIDDAEGTEEEKDAIRAQALTYRAYSYFMLSQLYAYRWKDSNGGATEAVVLRTDPNLEDLPLSTLGETYDLVYDDLEAAISLFESSGYTRSDFFEIDKSVAQAIFARAALTKEDYPTAAEYAALAREKYPLMDNSDYRAGFANPTSEWIWGSFDSEDETLFFYSFQAYIAYNSTSSNVRSYPKRISKELYDQIPDTDIRRDLFLDPEGYDVSSSTGKSGPDLDVHAREMYPDIQSNATTYAHMQFKFNANGMPGIGNLNHFRSSEMVLIEAEADYFMGGKDEEVQGLLEELTAATGRDPDYTCTVTGNDLLEEIKKYRAIELWGEGFDWFDLKRWKDPIEKKSFSEGGNFLDVLSGYIGPEEKNNWTWRVPLIEADNNKLVD